MSALYSDLEQICTVITVNGQVRFRIQNRVTAVKDDDLPSPNVFVHQIIANNDPKQDVFLRVASILDLTLLVQGRTNAVLKKQTTYLSNAFTVEFNDVATGTAAKKVIQARVDQLIKDWIQYNKDFIVPDHIPLPLFEASIVEAAKAAYSESLKEKDKQDALLKDANALFASAKADAAELAIDLADAQINSSACATTESMLVAGVTAANVFLTAAQNFKVVADAYREGSVSDSMYDSAKTTFASAIAAMQIGMGSLTDAQTRVASSCAAEAAAVTTYSTQKQAADLAVATTQTEQIKVQAAATDASKKAEAALAAVLEVCPDFTP